MGYYSEDGNFKVDKEFKKRRMMVNYPDLFPLFVPFEDREKTLKVVRENLKEVDFRGNVAIFCKYDLLKASVLYGFIKLGEYVNYDFMNAYRLLNITLGKDEQYSDVTYINKDYLVIYLGYREFNNKRQSDIVEQVIEDRIVRNKTTWIYYKGSQSKFKRKYKETLKLMENRGYEIVNIGIPEDLKLKGKDKKGSSSLDIDIDEI